MATENSVMAVIRAYRPTFRNPHDKIAFAVHASFLASGCFLTATGPPALSESPSSSSSDEVGIDGWNQTDDCYAFLYSKEEKGSKKFVLVKCLVMGDKLVVDALPIGSTEKEPLNLQINVNDYGGKSYSGNYGEQFKNLEDLVKSLNSQILTKLDGKQVAPSSSIPSPLRSETSARSERRKDPTPAFTEPYPSQHIFPPIVPFGGSDLYPGPGAGVYPNRGSFGIGGGMLVGPNDPRWFGAGGEQPGFPGGIPAVPPGARFDPYGPPDVPGFEPNRFVRNPRRGPMGGTHPDVEHFSDGSDIL